MKIYGPTGMAIALAGILLLGACNDSREIVETSGAPVIVFDSESHVYTVKANRDLLLEPEVINNEKATYRWLMNGVTVGREQTYLFNSPDVGEYFLKFEVTNPYDIVFEEVRIDVVEKELPLISMSVPEGGFILQVGTSREFTPVVQNEEQATFAWYVDDEIAASTKDYIFISDRVGEYTVRFRAENEDGSHEVQFGVSVREAGDMPFTWEWESDVFNTTVGRTILISPLSVSNAFDATYVWQVNGTEAQEDSSPDFSFTPFSPGKYILSVTMENEYLNSTETFTVNVFESDRYQREITSDSSIDATEILEFLPAPGQFINEYKDGDGNLIVINTMDQACRLAAELMEKRTYVSLGAFGGYIVVKFDHSIVNDGGYNLQILGNSHDGSSEPGIVWVMQDENGNGQPDGTWYELKGSEFGEPGTLYNYTVTYYKPEQAGMDIVWTDNYGNQGTVDVNNYHLQNYYPYWVTGNYYTLRGTRLEDRTVLHGANWYLGSFDWGYADNYGQDRLTDDENLQAGVCPNHFRISDAVDRNGNPVELKYIDFVKVQTGVQAKAGGLGEVSTEVFGFRDYNMIKQQ